MSSQCFLSISFLSFYQGCIFGQSDFQIRKTITVLPSNFLYHTIAKRQKYLSKRLRLAGFRGFCRRPRKKIGPNSKWIKNLSNMITPICNNLNWKHDDLSYRIKQSQPSFTVMRKVKKINCRWRWGMLVANKVSFYYIKYPFWPQNLMFVRTGCPEQFVKCMKKHLNLH